MKDKMNSLKIDPKEFECIKPVPWNEVFSMWRETEADRENWIEHYKNKGFSSWEEWRTAEIVEPLKLKDKKWGLYKLSLIHI